MLDDKGLAFDLPNSAQKPIEGLTVGPCRNEYHGCSNTAPRHLDPRTPATRSGHCT